MKCENCSEKHDGLYGSGRFCSVKCARGYSTKEKRLEINKKVSKTLTGRKSTTQTTNRYIFSTEERKKGGRRGSREKKKRIDCDFENLSWDELLEKYCKFGKLTHKFKKIIKEEQDNKCNSCGLDVWMEKPILLEIHHIDGIGRNNKRENLTGLCPNCHCQTDNWKFYNSKIYKGV